MPDRTILLTGGAGFVGRSIVAEFARRGVEPRCLVRKDSDTTVLDAAGIEKVEGELNDVASLAAALDGADTVVHAAALTGSSDPAENMAVNYEGTQNLIAACKDRDVRRAVAISTISVDIARRGAYGDSKLMADNAWLASGLDVTIIRPTLIFGPNSKQIDAIRRFVTMLPAVVPVIGDGKYRVQPVDVEDVAKVVVTAALERMPKRLYYTGGPEQMTFDEMLTRIMRRLGLKKHLLHAPYPLVYWTLALAGKFVKELPVNAAQVSTLCQDGICSAGETERDFGMSFTPFDRVLARDPA